MITHVVLFRPHAELTPDARATLIEAMLTALREIPSIRKVRIGPRVLVGRPYETQMRTHYSHAALLDFDDREGLETYLQHPAHDVLAAQFFAAFDEALIYDFELKEGEEGVEELRSSRP